MKLIKNRLPHLPMPIALASVLWQQDDDPHGMGRRPLFRLSLNSDMYPGLGLMVDENNPATEPVVHLCIRISCRAP